MKIAVRRALMVVSVLMAFLVVAVWAFSYHSFEFKGGMGIRDSGFLSYPRYHAELGELPLRKAGEYQFTVRGLPPESLDLSLQVLDATIDDTSELTSLSTSVRVSITDGSGKELCAASGKLSDAKRPGLSSWVLESSDSHAEFWHPRCLQLPISRYKTYSVKLTISGVDDRSPHKMLAPNLAGGGNELP